MQRTKTTKNIDPLPGKILVFGGVYSNLQALQKMRKIADELRIAPQNVISTGDIIGYCAQPEETLNFFNAWGAHSIAGNVEIQLREGEEECGCDFTEGSRCDIFSRRWYPFAQEKLRAENVTGLHDLPDFLTLDFAGKRIAVVHGSFFETSEFIFESSPQTVKEPNFAALNCDVILAGHAGLPFSAAADGHLWLNPGVIGMPANDGTTRVWYMILEEDAAGNFAFSHRSFDYDHETTARLMEDNRLPREYAHTLRTGLWDNCEILPPQETAAQGIPLTLDREIPALTK